MRTTNLLPSGTGRFAANLPTLPGPQPASPQVLQLLMQSIVQLNQKVDSLALRSQAPLEVQTRSRPNTITVETVEPPREIEKPPKTEKLDLGKLLDIFD